MKRKRIWVFPEFGKKLRKEALERDMSVLDYTKELTESIDHELNKKKRGKPPARLQIG